MLPDSYLKIDSQTHTVFSNLDYKTSQKIWRKFQVQQDLKIVNQSHQRYEIILNKVAGNAYQKVLIEEVGMPEFVIEKVLQNLPVQLEESLSWTVAQEKLAQFKQAGMDCDCQAIPYVKRYIFIENISNLKAVRQVLNQFMSEKDLPTKKGKWQSSIAMNHLLIRYILVQLEVIGCAAKSQEYEQ